MFRSYTMGATYEPYRIGTSIGTIDIVDDDFLWYNEVDIELDVNRGMAECLGYHTIKCYEEHNLPVAGNLLKAFQYYKQHYAFDLDFIIWMNKARNPLYSKYEKDIERLLLLL
jgi:hypothetical protein